MDTGRDINKDGNRIVIERQKQGKPPKLSSMGGK